MKRGHFIIDGTIRPIDADADEWDAARYERAVEANLRRIARTRVGSILLQHVIAPVFIVPLEELHGFPGAHAGAGGGWRPGSEWDDRRTPDTDEGVPLSGIAYTPSLFLHPDAPDPTPADDGLHPFRTDEVLFHEIFHCVEFQWGTQRVEVASPSADDIVTVDEHRAVRVSNMYASEAHRPLRGPYHHAAYLRADGNDLFASRGRIQGGGHIGFRGARPVRRHSGNTQHDQYIAFETRLIKQFVQDLPSLTAALESLPPVVCTYNPFRQYAQGNWDTLLLPEYWAPPALRPDDDAYQRMVDRTG